MLNHTWGHTRRDRLGADLSDAKLPGADLKRANLITPISLKPTCQGSRSLARPLSVSPREQIEDNVTKQEEEQYDQIARANHEFRAAYRANGLTGRARDARIREHKARRQEVLVEDGLRGNFAWVGSRLSQTFTGYGVQLWRVIGGMLVLYVGSALVHVEFGGMTLGDSLLYIIVTFSTSRPAEPELTGVVMRTVAGIEAFAGTAAIVFLGHVLGTREQV